MHPPDSYTLVTTHSCGRRDKTNVLVSNYTKSVWFVNGESFQKWAQVGKEFVNPPTFSKERYVPLSRCPYTTQGICLIIIAGLAVGTIGGGLNAI
jgi:hypothetical protein